MTTALLSGTQATNGWYTGSVQVSLIATDLDGPISSTTYAIDGGEVFNYTTPLIASNNGIHTIQFGSVDQAGNIESPRPSVTFRIGLPGDVNGDGVVDCADLALVKAAFGKNSGQTGFDVQADANVDGAIDIRDLAFITQRLPVGTNCRTQK